MVILDICLKYINTFIIQQSYYGSLNEDFVKIYKQHFEHTSAFHTIRLRLKNTEQINKYHSYDLLISVSTDVSTNFLSTITNICMFSDNDN